MTASRAVRRAREGFDDFVHSKPYIALIAAVVYVLWRSEDLLAAIAVLGVIGGLVLALVRDIVPMIPFVTMAPCVVHINKMPGELWQYALALLPVAAGLVIHLVCYKRNKLEWRKTNLLPSVLLVAAMVERGHAEVHIADGGRGQFLAQHDAVVVQTFQAVLKGTGRILKKMLIQKGFPVGRAVPEGKLAAVDLKRVFPAFVQAQVVVAAQKVELGEESFGVTAQPEEMIRLGGRYGRHGVSFRMTGERF